MGAPMLVLKNWLFSAVNSIGAVSPLMRATASSRPVITPLRAARSVTMVETFQRRAPSAKAASRRLPGTRRSMFSVVRTTTGTAISDSARLPAQPENLPTLPTAIPYTNKPKTIKTADSLTSVTERVSSAVLLWSPYSARYTPASPPTGVETSTVKPTIIRLPTMALARPPPSEPGAGVDWVNIFQSSAAKPLASSTLRIHTSTNRPSTIAPSDRVRPMAFERRRFLYRDWLRSIGRPSGSQALGLFGAHHHQLGGRQHHEGDHEQQKAQREQRGQVNVCRLAKLVRQRRGDRGAGPEQRGGHAVSIADHEGPRHGFTERAAQSQHDPADDPLLGVGQHHAAPHRPGGAAQAVGGLAQDGRDDLEHIAHHGGDERQHHECEHDAGRQDAETIGAAAKQKTDQRHGSEQLLHRHLEVVGKQRGKHEQAEHAVDDRRHRRQQFHGRAQRALQPYRAGFGQEQGDAEGQRHGDQQRNAGTDHGADDGDRGTEFFIEEDPFPAPPKLDAELVKRRPSVDEERDDDAQQRRQHQQRQTLRQPMEHHVLQALPPGNRCDGGGFGGRIAGLDHGQGLRIHRGSEAHGDSLKGRPSRRPSARATDGRQRGAIDYIGKGYFLICDQTLAPISAVRRSGSGT